MFNDSGGLCGRKLRPPLKSFRLARLDVLSLRFKSGHDAQRTWQRSGFDVLLIFIRELFRKSDVFLLPLAFGIPCQSSGHSSQSPSTLPMQNVSVVYDAARQFSCLSLWCSVRKPGRLAIFEDKGRKMSRSRETDVCSSWL
jgi:hypothetical protein